MIFGADVALRAIGTALAGLSLAFAAYMVAYGGYQIRINGMEYLMIFAQPRGPRAAPPLVLPPLDMMETGSFKPAPSPPQPPRPIEAIAARPGRVWLMIDGALRAASPGDDVPRLGRIGGVVPRDGGWVVLDDKGVTLLTVAKRANGAVMFSRGLIFH